MLPLKHRTEYVSRGRSPDYSENDDGIPVINQACIYWDGLRLENVKLHRFETAVGVRGRLHKHDVLINSTGTGTLGRAAVFKEDGEFLADSHVTIVRATADLEPRFLRYLLETTIYQGFIYAVLAPGATNQIELSREGLRAMPIPAPETDLQVRIADFLDRKTATIDELIAKKERLALLLQEKRQAVITQAVTKGLDPGVRMKESGIEWIGRVPEHWEVLPLRRVVSRFIDYRGRTPTKVDDGVPLITAGAIRDGQIDHARAPEYMEPSEYEEIMRRGRPRRGDLVFTTEAPLGEVALVEDTNVAFAQRIILFKMNTERMLSGFLRLYYLSDVGRSEVVSRGSGSTAEGIRADRLRASVVIVPPVEEQASIVSHVMATLSQHQPVQVRLNEQITKFREYRQSLITAAVTGKIDVGEQERAFDDKLQALEASG